MKPVHEWARLARVAELFDVIESLDATFYPESSKEWGSAAEMVERIEPIVRRARYILSSLREELARIDEVKR